jgi:hypothetical protein
MTKIVCTALVLVLFLPAYLAARPTADDTPAPAAPKVEVERGGAWLPATVLRTLGGRSYVHYEGYGDESDEWVGKERVRPLKGAAGQKVEVISGGSWWAATVVKTDGKKYFIHYNGWGDEWDEWVGKDRIYFLPVQAAAKAAAKAVEVEWSGTWWPATVLKTDGERTYIHYDGFGDEWDEWVGKDRIRPAKKNGDGEQKK